LNRWISRFRFACTLALLAIASSAVAQSAPTASRGYELSAFAGATGTYTGLQGSRNAAITAGVDLGFHPFFGLLPAIEIRGSYPVDSGAIVGQEDVMGGLRVQKRYNRIRPYVDILFGRGQLNYQNGGYVVVAQDFRYLQSTSNVISPGLGFEVDATEHFALLLDGQYQHWDLPFGTGANPAIPGSVYAKAGTIGVVYRFGWLQHGHPAP
jgi:hypothetical protein